METPGVVAVEPLAGDRPADRRYDAHLAYDAESSDKARDRGRALCLVTPLMLLFLGLFLWQYFQPNRIEPMIQIAQVHDGNIQLIGLPQKLLDWTPPEAQINDMLADWVRNFYARWPDPDTQKVNLHWVKRHTCGPAVKHLELLAEQDDTLMARARKVQIAVKTVEKTAAPRQYHVVWQEIETYATQKAKDPLYSSVMTVGRVKPTNIEWFQWNKSGLCVDAFSQKRPIEQKG